MAHVEIPLYYLDRIPPKIAGLSLQDITSVFEGPTLIELEGQKKQALFVSVLLHGNETSSFFVLQKLQQYFLDHPLPRSLKIFVGNIKAASENVRFIEGQRDYNRVWGDGDSLEHYLMDRVIRSAVVDGPLFASIDIHNNTGANPFYACINNLSPSFLYLGHLFSNTLVYFQNPSTAQSVAFSKMCPSVTLECGQSGQQEGVDKAFQLILDVLSLESLENHRMPTNPVVFETVGRIVLKNFVDYDFGFGESDTTLNLPVDFEKMNFGRIEVGQKFADYQGEVSPFHVYDEKGRDLFDQFFMVKDNCIYSKKETIPSMFTKNKQVIRQDCLGYIMQEVQFS